MKEKVVRITEDTLIPLSLLLVFIGGVAWLTNLHALSAETARRVKDIENKQDAYRAIVQSIDNRLNRIEGKLGVDK